MGYTKNCYNWIIKFWCILSNMSTYCHVACQQLVKDLDIEWNYYGQNKDFKVERINYMDLLKQKIQ